MAFVLISRKEAIEKGLGRYFTGSPCKHGHICERYTKVKHCIKCDYEKNKSDAGKARRERYLAANGEKVSGKYKQYWEKNAESLRAKKREYYAKNKEKITAQKRDYVEKNKEAIRVKRSENGWKYNDKARIQSSKRRALKKSADGSYTLSDVHDLMVCQNNKCSVCKKEISFGIKNNFHVDHMIPLSRGGSNWPENLQLLCTSCNCSKNNLLPLEWAEKRARAS